MAESEHSKSRDGACGCTHDPVFQDPVCGARTTRSRAGSAIEHAGRVYFFCSRQCREVFAAFPEVYAANAADRLAGQDAPPRPNLPARGGSDVEYKDTR